MLINNELLQFPALLEHARRVIPSPDTHPSYKVWVIPILIHTLLHQVFPNAGTDRPTIWENAETFVFFCWIMKLTNAQAWKPRNSKQRTLGPGRRDSRSDSIININVGIIIIRRISIIKFKNRPGSMLINSEMLQFPAFWSTPGGWYQVLIHILPTRSGWYQF